MSDIYELDGNTGFTAGVAEMLLQSHKGEMHILPGEFCGLVSYLQSCNKFINNLIYFI